MRRLVATPRWLGFHALAVLGILVCLQLGLWQWERAAAGDSVRPQNAAYAVQWVVFAGFVVFLWARTLRDELHPEARRRRGPKPETAEQEQRAREELAAYNAHLARLHEQSERQRG